MATTILGHINTSNGSNPHQHLKNSIEYVMNPDKTEGGRLIQGLNCIPYTAYEDMIDVKQFYGKTDGRQGYHFVVSLADGEGTPELCQQIGLDFAERFLGKRYQAVIATHTNTDNLHTHVVFNSVSVEDGLKYHYADGDWQKYIQPIVNDLCNKYNLSVIKLEKVNPNEGTDKNYSEWLADKQGRPTLKGTLKKAIDASIEQAADYEGFLRHLTAKGYDIKSGKYISAKPVDRPDGKYMRFYKLGDGYSESEIRQRIAGRLIAAGRSPKQSELQKPPVIQTGNGIVLKPEGKKLSPYQLQWVRTMYRLNRMQKSTKWKPGYWAYKQGLQKMDKLQQAYKYILSNQIASQADLRRRQSEIPGERHRAHAELKKLLKQYQIPKSADGKIHTFIGIAELHRAGYASLLEQLRREERLIHIILDDLAPIGLEKIRLKAAEAAYWYVVENNIRSASELTQRLADNQQKQQSRDYIND